jgi:hypothetical protein
MCKTRCCRTSQLLTYICRLFFHLPLLFFTISPFALTFLYHFFGAAHRWQNNTEQDYWVPLKDAPPFLSMGWASSRSSPPRHLLTPLLPPSDPSVTHHVQPAHHRWLIVIFKGGPLSSHCLVSPPVLLMGWALLHSSPPPPSSPSPLTSLSCPSIAHHILPGLHCQLIVTFTHYSSPPSSSLSPITSF